VNLTTPVRRVTIFCRDAAASLHCYRDMLGFDVIEDKRVSGPAIGRMVGL
jgi:catechol 2,3-dioxygenase-like lactoylglutathione lyase family enzyme